MLRRNLRSDFVGGAYVFPGGSVDEGDREVEVLARVVGLDEVVARRRLGLTEGALPYFVAALRELFEEAGLLLASPASGGELLDDPDRARRLAEARLALNAGERTFADLLRAEDLLLEAGELAYLAHWVTPVGPPRRFDTRFFVAAAPRGQTAGHDEGETVDSRWLTPREALAAHAAGEMEMILPTVTNLRAIEGHHDVETAVAAVRALGRVERVEPPIVQRDGTATILLPGEPGYDS